MNWGMLQAVLLSSTILVALLLLAGFHMLEVDVTFEVEEVFGPLVQNVGQIYDPHDDVLLLRLRLLLHSRSNSSFVAVVDL